MYACVCLSVSILKMTVLKNYKYENYESEREKKTIWICRYTLNRLKIFAYYKKLHNIYRLQYMAIK